MWLFTKYGFFSSVCAREGDGAYHRPVDPERIMVRARLRDHLESLINRFSDLLGDCEIMESPNADYRYRIFVPKSDWSKVLASLSEDMDYDNFKSKVAEHLGDAGRDYEHALHDIWDVMHRLQK